MAEKRVVLVHGGAVDQRSWDPVLGLLGADRHAVMLLRPTAAEICQALASAAVLVGASMGGGLALEAATQRPELVERLVLIAPMVDVAPVSFDETRTRALARAAAEGPAAFADALLADRWFAVGVDEPSARASLRAVLQANAPGQPGPSPWRAPRLSVPALTSLRTPVVVLVGDLDDRANIAMSTWTARTVARGSLIVVPRCGHLIELVRPDLVAAAIQGASPHPERE